MFERIVVPLDGSELAASVLAQVRRLLFHKDAEIILVRAYSVPQNVEAGTVELFAILQSQASRYLDDISNGLTAQGARVRTVTREGYPADVILDVAAEAKASLIAMSTHGRTGLARWTLGSVTEKVLRASRIPVLAVRSFSGSERVGASELSLQRILVPIDSTEVSLEVLPSVLELAKLFGSQVVLLNVCDGQECSIPVVQITEAYERFHAAGVPVEPLMKQGEPAGQILDTCAVQKADLIAMTTHGRSGISRWMLGSVTEKVLRAATVPILAVRPVRRPSSQGQAPAEPQGVQTWKGSAP